MSKKLNSCSDVMPQDTVFQTMFVIVQGERFKREVSHREDGGKLVPVLSEGEQCLHMINGECHIIQGHWPNQHIGRALRSIGNREESELEDGEL